MQIIDVRTDDTDRLRAKSKVSGPLVRYRRRRFGPSVGLQRTGNYECGQCRKKD